MSLARRASSSSVERANQVRPSVRAVEHAPVATKVDLPLVGLVLGLGLMMAVAALVTNGNPFATLAPLLVTFLGAAVVKVPLRVPAMVLMFVTFTFDTPVEPFAAGAWRSPVFVVSNLLLTQLKNTIPSGALVFTGMDVALVVLFGLHFYRRATNSRVDSAGYCPVPLPLIATAWLGLGGVALALIHGLVTGGIFRFALWQVERTIYVPIVFLLLQVAFPKPGDFRTIGRLIVIAACVRAVLAIGLKSQFPHADYMTSHSDSMLFGIAASLLLLRLTVAPKRGQVFSTFSILGLLVWGMVANNRRLVWADLGIGLTLTMVLTPWTRFKRKLARAIVIVSPVVLLYVAVGWASPHGIFKPVGTIRSIVDSKSDTSTLWRDLENFNLVSTLKSNPVLGTGLGHQFTMVVAMPDVTSTYELEPYLPHNSMLGIWTYTGYVGYCMLWANLVVGLYLAARVNYLGKVPIERAAALSCFTAITIYMLQCYGDMGLGSWQGTFLTASALTIAGKLAVSTGAWTMLPDGKATGASE